MEGKSKHLSETHPLLYDVAVVAIGFLVGGIALSFWNHMVMPQITAMFGSASSSVAKIATPPATTGSATGTGS